MATVDLADLARRPQRYWDLDGLPELVMGLLWMLWGGAWLVGEWLPRDGPSNVYRTTMPLVLVTSALAALWVIKRLKQRLTFPRSGYVTWKEPLAGARIAAAVIAAVVAAVLVRVAASDQASSAPLAPLVLGVLLSLAFVVVSMRQRTGHHLVLAGVALVLGVWFGATNTGWTSVNWMFVALGAATTIVGSVRFAIFLKRHPRSTLETP